MKKTLFTITLFVLNSFLFSQVTQEWVARYNSLVNGNAGGNSIVVDGSGNVYVTGCSNWSGFFVDYTTIKYNAAGIQQWAQRYNGPVGYTDIATSIAVDISGNVYVTGWSDGTWGNDYATVKYNSSGVQQWVQRYNGPGNNEDLAFSIAVDLSGNVYVTGWSGGSETSGDYATVKYNTAGVQQWVKRYNGPGNENDIAGSIAVDISGNVYVTGASYGIGSSYDYATIKYNSLGDSVWVKRYNGPANGGDNAYSIRVDQSGNVYVTGSTAIGTSYDYATVKYNSASVQQWVQIYNGFGNGWDIANSITIDNSGNVYVTGKSSINDTSYDYATLKYNSSGVQQWVQRYNGPGNYDDIAYSIAVDLSGNVYVGGESDENRIYSDYAVVKYNSSGVQQWVQRYNGQGNGYDILHSMVIDSSGNIYVTGGSFGNGYDEIATIKYSQSIGIQPISSEIPKSFSLSQNYPNPFNPNTVISFQLAVNSFASLKVFDILGREIATLVNEQLKPGTYEVSWNGSNYPSGVYFYKIVTPEYTESKKMILMK
jgi:uncharacterized delta-60 repeat protein